MQLSIQHTVYFSIICYTHIHPDTHSHTFSYAGTKAKKSMSIYTLWDFLVWDALFTISSKRLNDLLILPADVNKYR